MARRGLILALACLLVPAAAGAQTNSPSFTGLGTAFIGPAHGGDATDGGWTPGGSIAIIDVSGFGVEMDVSHVRAFDKRYEESGVTTLMFSATGVWKDPTAVVRPYLLGGAGLLHVRACSLDCGFKVNRTDWGLNAGGGVFVVFNEFVGIRGDVRYFRLLQRYRDLPLSGVGYFDFWRTSIGVTVSWPIR